MKTLFLFLTAVLSSCAIEKPDYETLRKDGDFELRKYNSIRVVSAPMEDMEKRNQSFRKLFKYISGENAEKKKIAMTSPVFMDGGNDSQKSAGRMSFMLPAKIAEVGAPSPDGEGLLIEKIESGTFAVLRFKGWNKEENRKAASASLQQLVSTNNFKPLDQEFFAFYNPPWTPEILRRNEIWQRVEAPQ